ncbi:hypothetical protein SAMD00019534_110250 [Acytostelium subglobosum LB1]|uniref:hypothetical protein n=1 Tax=Acytostelium subglobosum LB1 TaxID=1410327 RepID=UPI0006448604|nr:hypothetical protein SAMD00019534_110250 [Acytostelium subglobosum LB1]GAM27849.1 hypothetical protein SAMD00019534_110250 [Acytostelium subglobosum LB1]|eukprot:XP_012749132.1 hypothetical protein SAMD00019534_110250 [Acytostelium subglobosum LB1]
MGNTPAKTSNNTPRLTPEQQQQYDWDVQRYNAKRLWVSTLPRNYAVDQCKTNDPTEVFSPKRPNTHTFSNVQVPSMFSKGFTKQEDMTEYYDNLELIQNKVKIVAAQLLNSKYCVVYSGAGISTSADLPDFRGPEGCWTKQDKGIRDDGKKTPSLTEIVPTFAHMAIAKLCELDMIKCVITTNMDNLHLRSGVPHSKIVEMHGNSFKERCTVCQRFEYKTTEVYNTQMTKCSAVGCTGLMVDSIIDFAMPINDEDWQQSKEHSERSDLSIVLGTSMRVLPSCLLPELGPLKNGGNLVICNLQITPYDDNATRLFCTTDEFMYFLMKELNIEVPMATPKGEPIRQRDYPVQPKPYWKTSDQLDPASYDIPFRFLF